MRATASTWCRHRGGGISGVVGEEKLDRVIEEQTSWKYYDEEGKSPFGRYLGPDSKTGVFPRKRIFLLLLLGSSLSTVGVQLTADEYYEGPHITKLPIEANASDHSLVHIAFNNVGCSMLGIDTPLVSNITGEILPGHVTGIMGPSGSGKTTFAFALLGRNKRYCTGGDFGTVYLNGRPRNLEVFLDRVGYVPQDDVLYPDLTVKESLEFSANWRLPRDLSSRVKAEIVDDVLHTLDLYDIKDRRVGSVTNRGISGGERKRTSIGIELVSRPAVLVMDEPTSGLDSAGAFRLMKMLRAIAKNGVSVVTVIHQPSARVYSLIDDLILLQGGEAIFQGSRKLVLPFLEQVGFRKPPSVPEAEFILDVVAGLDVPSQGSEFVSYSEICDPPFGQASSSSAAEIVLPSLCMSKEDKRLHPTLAMLWREYSNTTLHQWPSISQKMSSLRNKEDLFSCIMNQTQDWLNAIDPPPIENFDEIKRACEQDVLNGRIGHDFDDMDGFLKPLLSLFGIAPCAEGDVRMLCTMLYAKRSSTLSNQQSSKPGLKRQFHLWYWQMMHLKYRRGFIYDIVAIATLAFTVSFVRSFNTSWNRRSVSNLFLSLSIGLLGMVGAVFEDEIAPVHRAASAGMLLGSHEFALLAESVTYGWCVSHVYGIFYFFGLWTRTGIWVAELPRDSKYLLKLKFQKYYEFTHLLHLNYMASCGIGNAICVLAEHDYSKSFVGAVAALIGGHVFSLFSPNHNQIKSTVICGRINIGKPVEMICQISYVRYFLEAVFLWDPSPMDRTGRNYVLKYFGYTDANKSYCATSMFSLWTLAQAVRFVVFGFRNSNDFHSLYDTPLFIIFIFKILSCHVVALLVVTMLQEWYFPWVAALQERVRNQREDFVDIVSISEND